MTTHDQEKGKSDFRVGLTAFVAGLIFVVGIAFAGGDKGLFFRSTSTVTARMANIGSLKKGSAVSISGMTVGKVTRIAFCTSGCDASQTPIEISMEIRSDVRRRIKTDSIPGLHTQGMLGDRYVDISMGSPESAPLPEGQSLIGKAATDFDDTLHQANTTLMETTKLLASVNQKQGTVGQLIHDREFYEKLLAITNELNDLIHDFKQHPRKYIKFSLF